MKKKKKEYEEEMKQYHPYEEELQRCTQLISYLETTLVKHNEHTTKQEAATKESVKVPEDVKLIGKRSKEEEAYFIGGKKSKNSNPATSSAAKQKQPATTETKAPTSTAITHTVNVFTEFQHVGIDPPLSYADIPKTVEELKKKRRITTKLLHHVKNQNEKKHTLTSPVMILIKDVKQIQIPPMISLFSLNKTVNLLLQLLLLKLNGVLENTKNLLQSLLLLLPLIPHPKRVHQIHHLL